AADAVHDRGGTNHLSVPSDKRGPRHNDETAVTNNHIADLYRTPLLLDLFTNKFKRLQNRKCIFDPISRFQMLNVLFFVARTYGGYDGSFCSTYYVRRVAEFADAIADMVDLDLCRFGLHCYNHLSITPIVMLGF